MAVNWTEKIDQALFPIEGVSLFVAQAGVKKLNHNDITVFTLKEGTKVAGVFTQNRFCAAPVHICKTRLDSKTNIRALVINTGNANAGTGLSGQQNALTVCEALANELNLLPEQVLPFSTGVILEPLPVEKITQSLPKLAPTTWLAAAKAIMTTDTVAKAASREISIEGELIKLTGIAKGSGMICPNMATMLGFVATDAAIEQDLLNQLIKEVADESFNCITVDGDTSTNDSFIVMATGQTKASQINKVDSPQYTLFKQALTSLALELAQAIIRDGEGATKFITVHVKNAQTKEDAKHVAYAIAQSPLIKTAFFASDPNLGRLLCAIGYSKATSLDVSTLQLYLDEVLVAEKGGRASSYNEEEGIRVMAKDEITVTVDLSLGTAETKVYTCDFSYDYVKINADYRT